jgi:hypothetical protein
MGLGLGAIGGGLAIGLAIGLGLGARASAASSRSTLEIFGVGAGDAIEIDGASVPVKTALAHAFTGQPLPGDAPAITELAAGTHTLTLHRAGCTARTFTVEVQGSYHRAIVVAPAASAHCTVPTMPPRVQ